MNVLLPVSPDGIPHIAPVVQKDVDGQASHDGEGETVAQGESGRHEDGRIGLILLFQEVAPGIDNLCHIVNLASVVVRVRARQRQIARPPGVRIVKNGCDESEMEEPTAEHIRLSPKGDNQRRAIVSDLAPVKRGRQVSEAGGHAEQVVHDLVVRGGPADEGEGAEAGEDEAREPVPAPAAYKDVEEEAVARDGPAVGDGVGAAVQRLEEGGVCEGRRPDHLRRLDDEAVAEAGQTEAEELHGEAEQELVADGSIGVVEGFLRLDDVGSLWRAAVNSCSGLEKVGDIPRRCRSSNWT